MNLPYRKIRFNPPDKFYGHFKYIPVIPIVLSVGLKSIGYAAVIDSGADFCIFDAEIGEELGLDIKGGLIVDYFGIDGAKPSKAYIHSVSMNINGQDYSTDVGFSYNMVDDFGVVGQKGFFDLCAVKFDTKKELIQIMQY